MTETLPPGPPAATAEPGATGLARVIGAIAADLDGLLPPGDVAGLRRLRPEEVASPAFWKLVATRLEPHGMLPGPAQARLEAERRWAVIVAGMAEMKGLHRPRARLGGALAEADVSEPRFLRLLRAHDAALFDAVRTTAHQLASRAVPVDWTDVARLVLTDGQENEEDVRRHVARDYYSKART